MKILAVLALTLALAACGAPRETPRNGGGNGADEMKLSPCACDPVPFNSEGFQWVG